MEIKSFKAGKTYTANSICDSDCIWSVKVIKRTSKFLTLKIQGHREPVRMGVKVRDGVETCKFLGSYSMAPTISAEREV